MNSLLTAGRIFAVSERKLAVLNRLLILGFDEYDDGGDPNVAFSRGGVAVVPVHGLLLKRSLGVPGFGAFTGYEQLAKLFASAMMDPGVKGVVFDVDSPGGSTDGAFDLADLVYATRGHKPTIAVCNDEMCSGAYCIASGADAVWTTCTGRIGSIGCYFAHVDQSAMDKQLGVKYTFIAAGDKKTEGNPHAPLADGARATLQTEVDRVRDMLVASVGRNRGVSAQRLLDTQGGIHFGPGGVPLFADRVGTLQDAVAELERKVNKRT